MSEHEIFKGIEIRKNTRDKKIVNEILWSYAWMLPQGCNVLDIGGCFGGYSFLAHKQGAKKIYCFEPDINNYQMCLLNTANHNGTKCFNEALTSSDEKEMDFYLSQGINKGTHSTIITRGRERVKVKARNFEEVLDELKPEIIKMDCEGSEYDLLVKPLPDYVKKITIEIHLSRKEWRGDKATKIIKLFDTWQVHKQPKIGERNWTTIGAWYR